MSPIQELEKPAAANSDSLQTLLNIHERVGSEKQNKNVIQRAIGMITQPEKAWREIAREEGGLVEAFLPYTLLTELVPTILGSVISFGLSVVFAGVYGELAEPPSVMASVMSGGSHYVSAVLGILVMGKLIEIIVPHFGARKSWVLSCRVLIYGSTPGALMCVLYYIPIVGSLASLVGLVWSISLIFQGYRILLKGSVS